MESRSDSDRQSCAFPGICVTPSGRWLVTFRAASTKAALGDQDALVCWSDNAGRNWTEPVSPFDPPDFGSTPGRFRTAYVTVLHDDSLLAALSWVDDSDPTRPFFNEVTEGLLDTRICLSRSTDDGVSWSASTFVDTSPLEVPTPLTGPILDLGGTGSLAIQLELNKDYLDNQPWHHRSMLLRSTDGGHTWSEHIVTSEDPSRRMFYWDQRAGVVGTGEILDLFWTYDRAKSEYLNIHARRSRNWGLDWSPLWDKGYPGSRPSLFVWLMVGS